MNHNFVFCVLLRAIAILVVISFFAGNLGIPVSKLGEACAISLIAALCLTAAKAMEAA